LSPRTGFLERVVEDVFLEPDRHHTLQSTSPPTPCLRASSPDSYLEDFSDTAAAVAAITAST
jgi:hypothetical protein